MQSVIKNTMLKIKRSGRVGCFRTLPIINDDGACICEEKYTLMWTEFSFAHLTWVCGTENGK